MSRPFRDLLIGDRLILVDEDGCPIPEGGYDGGRILTKINNSADSTNAVSPFDSRIQHCLPLNTDVVRVF